MWFSADNAVLVTAQAACIALPGAGLPEWTRRFRTRAWALALPLSIAVVVVCDRLIPETADALTWVALLLVPPGCALALGGRHAVRAHGSPCSRSRWRRSCGWRRTRARASSPRSC
jgi:hypothetical protein